MRLESPPCLELAGSVIEAIRATTTRQELLTLMEAVARESSRPDHSRLYLR